jgi:hypothetical protein
LSSRSITDIGLCADTGQPLFAEELTDALRERGAIIQDGEVWRAARSLLQALHEANALRTRRRFHWHLRGDAHLDAVTLGLPDTVHGLVLARLDLLTEEDAPDGQGGERHRARLRDPCAGRRAPARAGE